MAKKKISPCAYKCMGCLQGINKVWMAGSIKLCIHCVEYLYRVSHRYNKSVIDIRKEEQNGST